MIVRITCFYCPEKEWVFNSESSEDCDRYFEFKDEHNEAHLDRTPQWNFFVEDITAPGIVKPKSRLLWYGQVD